RMRVLPYSTIMHCTVNSQSNHRDFCEMIAVVFEVFFHFTRQIRYERVEAADFLSEHVRIIVILLDYLFSYSIFIHCKCTECNKSVDCNQWTECIHQVDTAQS